VVQSSTFVTLVNLNYYRHRAFFSVAYSHWVIVSIVRYLKYLVLAAVIVFKLFVTLLTYLILRF